MRRLKIIATIAAISSVANFALLQPVTASAGARVPVDEHGNECIVPGPQKAVGDLWSQTFTNRCNLTIYVEVFPEHGQSTGAAILPGRTETVLCSNSGADACGHFVRYSAEVTG